MDGDAWHVLVRAVRGACVMERVGRGEGGFVHWRKAEAGAGEGKEVKGNPSSSLDPHNFRIAEGGGGAGARTWRAMLQKAQRSRSCGRPFYRVKEGRGRRTEVGWSVGSLSLYASLTEGREDGLGGEGGFVSLGSSSSSTTTSLSVTVSPPWKIKIKISLSCD